MTSKKAREIKMAKEKLCDEARKKCAGHSGCFVHRALHGSSSVNISVLIVEGADNVIY